MKSVKCLEFDEKLQFSILEESESLPKVCKINKELKESSPLTGGTTKVLRSLINETLPHFGGRRLIV